MLLESGGCYRWKGLSKKLLDGITFLKVKGKVDLERLMNEVKSFSADGKVYLKRLMKDIKSLKRGNVDVNKLDTLLENMGISIKEREFMDLIERLPDADEGKVKLNTLMEELSTVLAEGKVY